VPRPRGRGFNVDVGMRSQIHMQCALQSSTLMSVILSAMTVATVYCVSVQRRLKALVAALAVVAVPAAAARDGQAEDAGIPQW
jgi:hypothetical protein